MYIGQSTNLLRRWRTHKSVAFNPNNSAYEAPLYRAMRKYGLEYFTFTILEECSLDELNEKEKQYILENNSLVPNGYNLAFGSSVIKKLTPDFVKNIIEDLRQTTENSEIIGKHYGVSGRTVRGINNGELWTQEDINYPIREALYDLHKEYTICLICGAEILKTQKYCSVECTHIGNRKVNRPDRETLKNLIYTSSFVDLGKQYGVSDNTIKKWCKSMDLPNTRKDIKQYSIEEWNLL